MPLIDVTVNFACSNPECSVAYSHAVWGSIFHDVEEIYEECIDPFKLGNCWKCEKSRIDIESITAKLVALKRKKFEITWRCESCCRSWIQTTWLVEKDVKDKDIIIRLREKIQCPNPGCDPSKKEYYITNIVRVDE